MASSDPAQQKTEAPTPRRLQEARRKGQVAKSRDFSAAVTLMTVVLFSYLLFQSLLAGWERQLSGYFGRCLNLSVNEQGLLQVLLDFLGTAVMMFMPYLLLLVGVTLAANLLQTGMIFAPEVIGLSFERLNPVNGLRRIFSLRSLVELAKSIFKVTVVAAVSYFVVKTHLPALLLIFSRAPGEAFQTVAKALLDVAAAAGGAYLVLSVGDLFYQRWEHIRGLRMTKQEVKEELKHTEGDPLVKSWQRRRQRQIALNLIRAEVPRATVVVTNPVHLAVALRYDEKETEAPVVTAKGAGDLARRIKEIAAEHNVPVVANEDVARVLYHQVDTGRQVPVALYQAVAEILAFVYKLKGKKVI